MFIRIFFIAAFVGAPFTFVEAKTIVLIGDSMSEFAKDTVDQFCGNVKSTNRGVGGTTATQVCCTCKKRHVRQIRNAHSLVANARSRQ